MVTDAFWDVFSQNSATWGALVRSGEQQRAFEGIDSLLERCELPFCFDLTSDDDFCYLIFSPEGDKACATAIDALVTVAPFVDGWKILGRRPKKNLADVRAIVKRLYLFDPSAARFRVYNNNDALRVEMYVPRSTDLTPEERQGLVNTFLWHAIGEDVVMNSGLTATLRVSGMTEENTLSAEELVDRFSV